MRIFFRFLLALVILSAGISVILAIDNPTPISVTGEDGIERIGYFLSMPDHPVSQPDDATIQILSPAGFNAQPQIDVLNSTVTQIRIDTATIAAANSGFNIFRSTAEVKIDALSASTVTLQSSINSHAATDMTQFTAAFSSISALGNSTQTLLSRANDIDVFRSTAQIKIDSWTLSQSTISSRFDDLNVFRSTAQIKIDALNTSTGTLYSLISTTSTNAVRVDGSTQTKTGGLNVIGKLGVGTSTPDSNGNLHILSSLVYPGFLESSNTLGSYIHFKKTSGTSREWSIGASGSASAAGDNKLAIVDDTASSFRLVISSLGNVGVGIVSPERLLDVYSGGGDVLRLGAWANLSGDTSGGAVAGSNFYRIYNGAANVFRYTNTHGTLGYSGTLYDSGSMYFYNALGATTKDADFTPSLRAMIDSSGNFGIGNSSPQQLFHISASNFVVTSAGNVGVGTTNPESVLHVAGSIPVMTLQGSNEFLGPQFRFRDSAGTLASPSIPTQPDFYAGALYWDAYNGSAWKGVGAFLVNGDGTPSATSLPTSFNFLTTSPNQVNASVKAQLNSTGDMFVNSINASDTNRLGVGTFSMATGAQFEVTKSSFVVLTSGNVGIGTSAPIQKLHVADQTTNGAQALLQSFRSSSGSNSQLTFNKARGTIASPSSVTYGDTIGQYSFNAYDGTSYIPAASILSGVDSTPGTNDMPGNLIFRTTADGASATSERMRIDNAGNVGIGTNSPTQKLHVSGNLSMTDGTGNAWAIRGSTGNYSIQYYNDGSRYPIRFVGADDGANHRWFEFGYYTGDNSVSNSNWNPKVSIDGYGGNVGIGTINPSSRLQLGNLTASSTSSPESISLGATYSSSAGSNAKLKLYNDGSGTFGFGVSSNQLDYMSNGDHVFYYGNSPTELMRIKSGGTVGIGTNNPLAALVVSGGSGKNMEFGYSASLGSNYIESFDRGSSAAMDMTYYIANNSHHHRFYTNGTEVMRITGTGNVGVGTTGPATKLQLVGTSPEISFGDQNYDQSPYSRIGVASGSASPTYIFYNAQNAYHDGANWVHVNDAGFGGKAVRSYLYNGVWGVSVSTWTSHIVGWKEAIVVDNSGNVGMGVGSPTQNLDVANDAHKGSGGLSWAVTSDGRLKNINGSFSAGLKEIETLNPVRFSYKSDLKKVEQIGLVAQEVQKVIPEAVQTGADGYLNMHADPVIWAMLNSIKELSEKIKKLEAKNK